MSLWHRLRSFSNCMIFAWAVFRKRRAIYEGMEDGRYICFRKSDSRCYPHALYGQMCDDGRIHVVSYKPVSPRRRRFPPPLFRGAVKWGDRGRKTPE